MALRVGVREYRESHARTREAEVRRPPPGTFIVIVMCSERDLQCQPEGLWPEIISLFEVEFACYTSRLVEHIQRDKARERISATLE